MKLQGRALSILVFLAMLLAGCLSNVWTGATLVYDRHGVYKKLNDYHLMVEVNNSLYVDKIFKCTSCSLDIAVFNGDILIAGHLPSQALVEKMRGRLQQIKESCHLYEEVDVRISPSASIQDSWITTKIRSQIFADDSIDPNAVKIITSDGIVYLMGDVKKDQADKIVAIARSTTDVTRVVKLLHYLVYESKKTKV